MLRRGICDVDDYLKARDGLRASGQSISCALLDMDGEPTAEQIRMFEDIQFRLSTPNGTFRTSFAHRFRDVDAAAQQVLRGLYSANAAIRVQDRAASHAVTSYEWAQLLLPDFPHATLEASDLVLFLIRINLGGGRIYVVTPDGKPIQYIRPPFVLSLCAREARRYPVNQILAARARSWYRRHLQARVRATSGGDVAAGMVRISCVHPLARALAAADARFRVVHRSVFDISDPVHVVRTLNILNPAYFSKAQLLAGAAAVFRSLTPGGVWIVGSTSEDDFRNHVSLLQRSETTWTLLERVGGGAEIEVLALQSAPLEGAA